MNLQSVCNLVAAKYATNNCTANTKIPATGNRQRFRFHELPPLSHDGQTDSGCFDWLLPAGSVRSFMTDSCSGCAVGRGSSVVFSRRKCRNFGDIELKQGVGGCNLTPYLVFIYRMSDWKRNPVIDCILRVTTIQGVYYLCSARRIATDYVWSSVVAPSCSAPRYKNYLCFRNRFMLSRALQICRLLSIFYSVRGCGRFVNSG